MVQILSHTTRRAPTLNAITALDRAARHARRLHLCQRLGDLGMELAEATQREALRELQPRPERRPAPPGTWMPPSPPVFRSTAQAELFATLSRCVRQAILLEARLDSGALDRPPPARTTPAEAHDFPIPRTQTPGDSTRIHHEALEDDLAGESNRPADETLAEISQHLGQALPRLETPSRHARAAPNAPRPNRPPANPHTKPVPPPNKRPPPKPA